MSERVSEKVREQNYFKNLPPKFKIHNHNHNSDPITKKRVKDFCVDRKVKTYSPEIQSKKVVHFASSKKENRLLTHFYEFLMFTDPKIENHYKVSERSDASEP